MLRRDGSKAEPFAAIVESRPAAAADDFDWRDAAIGSGLGAAAVLLAMMITVALRGRGRDASQAMKPRSREASG